MKKLLIILLLSAALPGFGAGSYDCDGIAPHPRLLLPAGGEEAVRRAVAADPGLQQVEQRILRFCDSVLAAPPVERILEGKRLLGVSREALKRIFYLAYGFRMTGDEGYAARAAAEMEAVSRFSDWNPAHFLDVGEMTMALAIGYDWLYDRLTAEQRRTVCEAICEKGFRAAENPRHAWFYHSPINWNPVCNSGLTFGALAIFDEAPDAARTIIEKCLATNPQALACYAPDGGYPEGFNYWGYGTSFEVLLIAALESAFGHDHGLSEAPGFLATARFMAYMSAPSGECFSFSDSPRSADCNMMLFWFARRLGDPSVLWLERSRIRDPQARFAEDRLLPSLLIFAAQCDLDAMRPPKQRSWHNRGETPLYIYRSGWERPDDAYLGIKGGSASTSHAHMDAGSFVYERDGVRWSTDLGMQSYFSLESRGIDLWNTAQESPRWEVFRLSNPAHSTLTVNGSRHNVKGFAPILRTFGKPGRHGAEVDLTEIFAGQLERAVRTVTLDRKEQLTVVDRITTGAAAEVMWVMNTPAEARIAGSDRIELTQAGRRMLLTVGCPEAFEVKIWPNDPPHDYDHPNPGTRRVGFVCRLPAGSEAVLTVRLTALP